MSQTDFEIGYRGATACAAAGITYRQLDYWARTALVEPSIRSAGGSGTQRLYGFRDILVLKIVKRLLDAGVSLQNIRTAVDHLRGRGVTELERITLMSDGASIYECASADEMYDLVQGGQGVFGIAQQPQHRFDAPAMLSWVRHRLGDAHRGQLTAGRRQAAVHPVRCQQRCRPAKVERQGTDHQVGRTVAQCPGGVPDVGVSDPDAFCHKGSGRAGQHEGCRHVSPAGRLVRPSADS